ncbi:MAG: histidine--tRNA ligase [archaeon]|nr:histidine--tRNA ligase [archaeon]
MKTVRGMQDFVGENARKKQFVEDTCRQVFESYGFEPLQTPALEELETLTKKDTAGTAIKDEIYFFNDKGGREIGLRFDLTVPLARVVASNPALKKPFKRYQIAQVWRYDRPQAKRWREFTQADADIIGSPLVSADFECVLIAVDVLKKLGVKGKIKVNNRKLLEDFAVACGVKKDQAKECFRCMDKLDKIGTKEVEKELKEKKIKTEIVAKLSCSIKELQKIIPSSEGLKEINELFSLAKKTGVEEFLEFDLSLARGLEYYTGNVFEVKSDGPSIGGGGRYDNLISDMGGAKVPAVGISFGVERVMELVKEKNPNGTKVFIAPFSKDFFEPALLLCQKIRALGISTEIDLMNRNVSKSLEFASGKKIPFAIVFGENEEKEKAFNLKNMATGKQEKIRFNELEKLKKL